MPAKKKENDAKDVPLVIHIDYTTIQVMWKCLHDALYQETTYQFDTLKMANETILEMKRNIDRAKNILEHHCNMLDGGDTIGGFKSCYGETFNYPSWEETVEYAKRT